MDCLEAGWKILQARMAPWSVGGECFALERPWEHKTLAFPWGFQGSLGAPMGTEDTCIAMGIPGGSLLPQRDRVCAQENLVDFAGRAGCACLLVSPLDGSWGVWEYCGDLEGVCGGLWGSCGDLWLSLLTLGASVWWYCRV